MEEQIRSILRDNARLSVDVATLSADSNLQEAGMSSHATVNVMLALEDEFDIEFPARFLRRAIFSSIASIRDAIAELIAHPELA